jgi:hypothetical protein
MSMFTLIGMPGGPYRLDVDVDGRFGASEMRPSCPCEPGPHWHSVCSGAGSFAELAAALAARAVPAPSGWSLLGGGQ